MYQQSLTACLHPSTYPKEESFKDVAAFLPHDPDNPSSGPPDASPLDPPNITVSSGTTNLSDLLGSPEDVPCLAQSVRMVLSDSVEVPVPSLPEASVLLPSET